MNVSKLFFAIAVVFLINACKEKSGYQEKKGITENENKRPTQKNGEQLAKQYCATCHQYPEPTLLDVATWKDYMLPRMGYMYGFYKNPEEREALFEKNEGGEIVRNSGLFPEEPVISIEKWNAIQQYYMENAPEVLEEPTPKSIVKQLPQFEVLIPEQKVKMPSTTMANFGKDGSLFIGDAMTQSFSLFSQDLQLLQSASIREGAVSNTEFSDAYWITFMGSFSPTDAPLGMIAEIPTVKNKRADIAIQKLQRPVHASYDDLNGDGLKDIVVCEFGKWTGALSYFQQKETGGYEKKTLRDTPGAIKAYIKDMNNDGFKDVVALFAQGDEGIDIYYNDGAANFTRKRVLAFSPSMGSSFFNLIDYNKDGHLDIIYTAGDNADYKPVMKPWHGVYVFENDGKNNFTEILFLHLNGAYNAIANDFDADGDIDIAAISFFPDWEKTPEESFVYFENIDGAIENYSLQTFPQVNMGRWVVMDANDYDKDGDIDLVIGSLAFEVVPKLGFEEKWMERGIPFIVLKNTNR